MEIPQAVAEVDQAAQQLAAVRATLPNTYVVDGRIPEYAIDGGLSGRAETRFFGGDQGGNTSMKTVGDIMEAEQYGLAVKKGNDKLAGEINKALAEMQADGTAQTIHQRWFGESK